MATWTPAGPLTACVGQNVSITPATQQANGANAASGNQLVEFALVASAGTVSPAAAVTGNPAQLTVPGGAATVTATEQQWQRLGTHGIYTGLLTAAPRTGDAAIQITLAGALVTPGVTNGHHIHIDDFDIQFNGTNVLANYAGVFQALVTAGYAAGDVYQLRITGTLVEVLRNAVVVYTFAQAAVLANNERAGFSLSSGTATSADHTAFLPNIVLTGTFAALAIATFNVTGVTAAIVPATAQTVPVGGTFNFNGTPAGGVWSVASNTTGSSISQAGLYAAGNNPGTDVLQYEVATGCVTTVTVNVIPAFFFAPDSPLNQASVSAAFSHDFTPEVSGGIAPYTFTVVGGVLPPGLSLGSVTGILSGTPTAGGTFTFTIRVTDSTGAQVQCSVTLIVEPTLVVLPVAPTVYSGSQTQFQANVAGGTWSSVDCSLSVSTTGVFTAPNNTSGANQTCSVTYTTPAGQTQTRIITIEPVLVITPQNPTIVGGGVQAFVGNLSDLTWFSNCGTITDDGIFTAPEVSTPIACTIAALAKSGQTASIAVTVYPRLSVSPVSLTVSLDAQGLLQVNGGSGNYSVTQPSCGTLAETGVIGQYLFTGVTSTADSDGPVCVPSASNTCSTVICDSLTGECVTVPLAVTDVLTLSPAPALGESCVRTQVGSQITLTLTGGSGQYSWKWQGDGYMDSNRPGVFNTGTQAGEVIVTVRDLITNEEAEVTLCVEGSTACVVALPCPEPDEIIPCCETTLDCMQACHLSVPGLFVNSRVKKNALPTYRRFSNVTAGELGQLTCTSSAGGAIADIIPKGEEASVTFFITPSMMVPGNQTGVGWSEFDPNVLAATIGYAAIINSNGLQVWQDGVAVAKRSGIRVGDEVKVAIVDKAIIVYHQGVPVYTFDAPLCNLLQLDFSFIGAISIGGPASASFVVVTPGAPSAIGTVTASGRYTAGNSGGTVLIAAHVGNSILYHTVNVTEPTPIELDPNDVWTGGVDSIWANVQKIAPGQRPKLATDGSPSRDVSPNAIGFLGDYTVDGVEFKFDRKLNEIKIEGGTIDTEEQDIMIEITFKMAQTRNANLLAIFNPNAQVRRLGGGTQIVVGRQKCSSRKFNLLLVKESKCGGGKFDTFYVPNARVTSGVTHTFKRGELVSHEVVVTAYVDLACSKTLYLQTLETACVEAACELGSDGTLRDINGALVY